MLLQPTDGEITSFSQLRKRPELKSKTRSVLEDAAKAVLGQWIERSKGRSRMREYKSGCLENEGAG